ncbi:DUF4920 domain-containing protein [Formosa sediminum]|uniref:DUF4920 domain-containing protein n=1 Tax=Formosa sediminum TaxID=2594004 RepID=A0A516GUY4_9FLAO|nr:DUF4920 domain-containing protein [Formosa sediminum]QDO95200.1 DUF4920 domain-containing protein [Formosa sediminum]
MKKVILFFAISVVLNSCKNESKQAAVVIEETVPEVIYAGFGKNIHQDNALTPEHMIAQYKNLKIGDTIDTKMKGTIRDVCSKKGCWMTLDIGGDNQVMVKFKDYGFFMPLDAEGDVIVNGKAYITETSVDELRHYAEDAGKSSEDIAMITTPKLEYHFEADGVLLERIN